MIQVYVPIHDRRVITIPAVVCKASGVEEGQWLRMTVLDDERALVERVVPEAPSDHVAAGAISSRRAKDGTSSPAQDDDVGTQRR